MTKLAFSPRDPGHLKPIVDVGNPLYYIQRSIECLNHAKLAFGSSGCRYNDEMHTAVRLAMLACLYTEGWNDEADRATRLAEGFLAKIKSGDIIQAANGRLHILSAEQIDVIKHNAIEQYKIDDAEREANARPPVKSPVSHTLDDSEISEDGNGSGVGCSQPGIGHTGAV
jgi:hypothetical protein